MITLIFLTLIFATVAMKIKTIKNRNNEEKKKIDIIELRRKRLIEEYGHDPYSIAETMKFHRIPYNPKTNSESKAAIYTSRTYIKNENQGGYLYLGKDDPVHRPHCYIIDPDTGRRKRVYLDEEDYEDADK